MVMRAKLVERSGRELESLVTRREINWLGILLHSIAIFILVKKLPSTSFLRRVSQEVSLTGKRAGGEGVIGGKLIDYSEVDPWVGNWI